MAAKIFESNDYGRFELLNFNRNVGRTKHLEESMRRHGWIDAYPMHVVASGRKLKIKSGHHRFTVARKLGLPVKYVLCDDDSVTIHELEKATNTWKLHDYLTSFVRDGRRDYIVVDEYHRRTGISLKSCISMFGGDSASSGNKGELFKSGGFRVVDTYHAETVAEIIQHCKDCGIAWAANSRLVNAVSRVVWVDALDVEQLKQKIVSHGYMIEKQPSVAAYVQMIEDVYNRQCRSGSKLPIAFLSDEIAKQRSAVKPKLLSLASA